MKNKILHLITGLEIGGAEKALKTNLPHLDQFENIICSLTSKGPIGEQIEKMGYRVYCLDSGKSMTLKSIIEFYRIVKEEKPSLIITYLIHADIYGRIFGKLFGVSNIVCYLRSELNDNKYKIFFNIEKLTSGLVSKYFAVSDTVKNTYIKKIEISPKKIVTIYNGVDIERFSREPQESTKYDLGLTANDSPIITCVAKLRPEKNHKKIIEILSELIKDHPQTKLLLVGDGPLKADLIDLSKSLNLSNSVIFLGNRENIPEILAITDIFILLSDYEGLANAIIEAMASSCCIIASDIPSNKELIENGINGYLVNKDDNIKILSTLKKIIGNQELRMELKKHAKIKANNFSIENTSKQFQKEIVSVLNN